MSQAIELQLGSGLTTDNRVGVRRVATPSILRVAPHRGYYARPQWVRVEGYGFLSSPHLSCRFVARDQVCPLAIGSGRGRDAGWAALGNSGRPRVWS